MFLDVPSVYVGKEEGAVFTFSDKILKINQPYQTDQASRNKIKDQYRGDTEYEDAYWKNIQDESYKAIKSSNSQEMQDAMKDVAKFLKGYTPETTHFRKNKTQVLEDIAITARLILSKKLNSGSLIIGKFRVVSNAHYDIIKGATSTYDTTTVNIVSSKDTKGTKDLRNRMIEACFSDIEILNGSTGNIVTMLAKSHNEITAVLCGSDRVSSYEEQIKKQLGVRVVETKRTDEDISASKLIKNIHDEEYFKNNTPSQIWPMYEEIRETYSN